MKASVNDNHCGFIPRIIIYILLLLWGFYRYWRYIYGAFWICYHFESEVIFSI